MTDEDSFFKREVQKDYRICNNCFRRCRDIFHPTHWLRPIKVEADDGTKVDTVEVEPVRDSVPTRSFNVPLLDQTDEANDRRVCKCGMFSPTTVMRDADNALTKKESARLAGRLADRLEEKASGFNRTDFLQSVWRYKSDEELSNKDDEVFQKATEDAI